MSVPLDNLYHWVDGLLPGPAVLYVFRPHGSKNISDCVFLKDYDLSVVYKLPAVIAYDQEPLDWDLYQDSEKYKESVHWKIFNPSSELRLKYYSNFNLKSIALMGSAVLYDQVVLIHSEKNSVDLEKYQQNGFACVHYWAHAVIARDWYRFAQHDSRLGTDPDPQHKFLIYSRDWSHRREYRLKFLELLRQNSLDNISQTSVMHTNSEGVHFSQHQFENPEFELTDPDSINQISVNSSSSASSADYEYIDFANTEISVVLETVFDDSRIHLTEKTLRPIACGHPFLLAAGPGALEYVKSYGFKTFAPWIDESYDQEPNALKRLEKIIQAMSQIQKLKGTDLKDFRNEIKQVSEFNKKHFFSDEFFDQVKNELKNNLAQAYKQVSKTKGTHYLELMKVLKQQGVADYLPWRREKTQFIRHLRRHGQCDLSNPLANPLV